MIEDLSKLIFDYGVEKNLTKSSILMAKTI